MSTFQHLRVFFRTRASAGAGARARAGAGARAWAWARASAAALLEFSVTLLIAEKHLYRRKKTYVTDASTQITTFRPARAFVKCMVGRMMCLCNGSVFYSVLAA